MSLFQIEVLRVVLFALTPDSSMTNLEVSKTFPCKFVRLPSIIICC